MTIGERTAVANDSAPSFTQSAACVAKRGAAVHAGQRRRLAALGELSHWLRVLPTPVAETEEEMAVRQAAEQVWYQLVSAHL
jgi:hypothetical protein